MTGILFDLRKYSIHDGPGIRTSFFLKGCPLSCAWCHNPEGLSSGKELVFHPDRCLGSADCGACLEACPRGSAGPVLEPGTSEGAASANSAACTVCGLCVAACPAEARQVSGFGLSVEDALARAREDEPFYDGSGGGVTFTGGEPFSQPGFLLECLAAFGAGGLRTAVDTCGYAPSGIVETAAAMTDLFLYDLKLMDSREHERWTGVPNDRILEILRLLAARGSSIWVRIPLIPGVNDTEENLETAAEFLSALDFSRGFGRAGERSVQILPYHDSARRKYALRGLDYPFDASRPERTRPEEACEYFRRRGIPVRIGG